MDKPYVRAARWATAATRLNRDAVDKYLMIYEAIRRGVPLDLTRVVDELDQMRTIRTPTGMVYNFTANMRTPKGQALLAVTLRKAISFLDDVALQNYGVWEVMDAKITHRNRVTEDNLRRCISAICLRFIVEHANTVLMSRRSWQQTIQAMHGGAVPGQRTLDLAIKYMVDSGYFLVEKSRQGDRDGCTTFTILPDFNPLVNRDDMEYWYAPYEPVMDFIRSEEIERRIERQNNAPKIRQEILAKQNREVTQHIKNHGIPGTNRVSFGEAA